MTDSDLNEKAQLLKTDRLGRVLTPRDQREAILDAFETSALSGIKFAQVHGIKYQTFATWRQKRRRLHGDCKIKRAATPERLELTLAEVKIQSPLPPAQEESRKDMRVELPCGVNVFIHDAGQVAMGAELIRLTTQLK
jgi:predicted secreted Zn-dependent protease